MDIVRKEIKLYPEREITVPHVLDNFMNKKQFDQMQYPLNFPHVQPATEIKDPLQQGSSLSH